MGEDRNTRALINAYGFDLKDPGATTKERRIGSGAPEDGQAPDTVEMWENAAIVELLSNLHAVQHDKIPWIWIKRYMDGDIVESHADTLTMPHVERTYDLPVGRIRSNHSQRDLYAYVRGIPLLNHIENGWMGGNAFYYQAPRYEIAELRIEVFFKGQVPIVVFKSRAASLTEVTNSWARCPQLKLRRTRKISIRELSAAGKTRAPVSFLASCGLNNRLQVAPSSL